MASLSQVEQALASTNARIAEMEAKLRASTVETSGRQCDGKVRGWPVLLLLSFVLGSMLADYGFRIVRRG